MQCSGGSDSRSRGKLIRQSQIMCLLLGKKAGTAGVIGIVASRLVERFYRPTIVLSYDREKGLAKGSARSIAGFDLI